MACLTYYRKSAVVGRNPLLTSFLCLILILGAFMLLRLNGNDPDRIKNNLVLLDKMVSKTARKPDRPFLTKIKEAKILLEKSCQIIIDEDTISGTYSPEQVAALITRFHEQIAETRLFFYDIKISFPNKQKAILHCTARLMGTTLSNGKFDEFRKLKILTAKTRGKWRFTRFQTIESVKK